MTSKLIFLFSYTAFIDKDDIDIHKESIYVEIKLTGFKKMLYKYYVIRLYYR